MKAILRLAGFLGLIFLFLIPLALTNLFSRNKGTRFLQLFYAGVQKLWGIQVEVAGALAAQRPLLVVSNHCSYLDVPVLGALIPVRFTPKSEVRGWPGIGYLCEMASCIFIDRRREKTSENRKKLLKTLEQGTIISLFPEGTTNDGSAPLPFKSSFFSLAEEVINGQPLTVQPISVTYFRRDGAPLSRIEMDKVAWFGDAEFVPHLWDYCKTPGVQVKVQFHDALHIGQFADRKALANHCQKLITDAVAKKERLVAEALPNNGG